MLCEGTYYAKLCRGGYRKVHTVQDELFTDDLLINNVTIGYCLHKSLRTLNCAYRCESWYHTHEAWHWHLPQKPWKDVVNKNTTGNGKCILTGIWWYIPKLGYMPGEHTIIVDETVPPVVHPCRKIPFLLQDKLKDKLERMEQQRVMVVTG